MNSNHIGVKVIGDARMATESLHGLSKSFTTLGRDGKRADSTITGLTKSLFSLKGLVGAVSLYKLTNMFAGFTKSAMDMTESIHLFNVAMGDMAEDTEKVVSAMSAVSGLDNTKLLDTVGSYNLLARSMGVTAKNAQVLSVNTSKLAIDLSALTNRSIQKVSEDLRSGLIGQAKTMYKYGIDVTEASIKQEALNRGIAKSVRHMSQSEKMALRYAVMIRQASLSHGDFAKTIDTPANQLRILSERMLTLGRTIGTIFIPMIAKVLPWINAFVIVLTRLASALARIFGYKGESPIKNMKNDFMGGAGGADDLADSVGGAGKKVDKLKKKLQALAGFDELNILGTKQPDPEDADAGGGKLGDTGGGFEIDLEGYDNLFDSIKDKTDALVDSLEKGFKIIWEIVKAIGIVMLAWKISNVLLELMTGGGLFGGLLTGVKTLLTKFGLLGTAGVTALGLIMATVTIMLARFVHLITHSENFRKGLEVIWETSKKVFGWLGEILLKIGGYFVDLGKKFINSLPIADDAPIKRFFGMFSGLTEGLGLDWADLLITLAGIALLFTGAGAPFGIALLKFEALTVAIRAIGYGAKDAIDEIDFLAEGIGEATVAKLEPFREKMNELNDTLMTINWSGMVMDDTVIADVQAKLREVTNMIVTELDSDQNEALKKLAPLRDALGKEAFDKLMEANKEYYDTTKQSVLDDEQEILDIMANAKKNGGVLEEEHLMAIQEIRDRMNTTGLKHIAETEIEYNKIMGILSDNSQRISLEQASGIIKNSLETKEKTIADAWEQYSTIELEAQRMLEVKAINDKEYKAIMESAEDARKSTIEDAEEQYKNIHKATVDGLGETGKFIDTETGKIKSKWTVWNEDLNKKLDGTWDNMKNTVSNVGKDMKDDWETTKKDMSTMADNVKTSITTSFDNLKTNLGKIVDGIKTTMETTVNNLYDYIEKKFDSMAEAIAKPIDWARDQIELAVNAIKGFFENLSLKIPKIEMPSLPKFEMEGKFSLNPPSVPKLGVKWNAKGGVMDSATIFGGSGNTLFGGGEAGREGIVPLEGRHMMPLADAIAERLNDVLANQKETIREDGGIIIQIGERTILDTLVSGVNRDTRINGKSVIRV